MKLNPFRGYGITKKFRGMVEGPPIFVFVFDGKWEAASPRVPPTRRDRALFALLQDLGGISNKVKEGTWHFNIERKLFRLYATLVEAEPDYPS